MSTFPFWDFSLLTYARPGVAEAAIDLQDHQGLDVNVLLLCLWASSSGAPPLEAAALGACLSAVREWQHGVVRPLRNLRRQPASAEVTQRLLAAELAAEQIEQQLLAATLRLQEPAERLGATPSEVAWQNLLTYVAIAGVTLGGTGESRLKALLQGLPG